MRSSKLFKTFISGSVIMMLLILVQGSAMLAAPTSVTLAGTLQTALGCTEDWSPPCTDSQLTYDQTNDIWSATYKLPTGDYEYKAALNGAWDESYGAKPDDGNIAISLAQETDVKFYYDDKTNWVGDNQGSTIATVAGTIQSKVGCAEDWKPECLRSLMTDVTGDGVYTFVTNAIPAGDYDFKVALNEAWDDSYGVDGGGDNITFTVPDGSQKVTFSFDPTTTIPQVKVEADDSGGSGPEPGDEDLVQAVIKRPFQDEILYFAVPDRFNDADTSNNCGDFSGSCVTGDTEQNVLTHGYLPSDKGYYHGGDIKGLIARLDYLQNMGVTAVWVGPIFKNKAVQVDSGNLYGHSSAYHGYWITDFMSVDPHLGTNDDFKNLVDQAHARGINVYMDIITNHTADVIQPTGGDGSYRSKTDFPYKDADGNIFNDSEKAYYGQADYAFPTLNESSFPYGYTVTDTEVTIKNPAWLNDSLMYHNRGNTTFSGENSLYGDFFGLDDLFTERQEVVDGMIDIYKHWITTYKVDGFRIDTTKHVNMEFWQKFGPDIEAAAKAEGLDHFFAFGEVYDQNYGPSFLSEFSNRGKLQATIDFAFQMAARDFASQGGASDNLKDFFGKDDYYTNANVNGYAQPTFLGNHDMGRIGYFLRTDNPNATDDELLKRSQLAHAMMFFARGQPVIYYGDEQGFTGNGGDKDARQDMFANVVDQYQSDSDKLIGSDQTVNDNNFNSRHPLYQTLKDLSTLYSQNTALRSGAQIHRASSDQPGVYAFSRIDREEKVEYIIAFNNNPGTATGSRQGGNGIEIEVLTYSPDTTSFTEVYNSETGLPRINYLPIIYYTSATTATSRLMETKLSGAQASDSGTVKLTVPPLGFVVYKSASQIPTSDSAPGITISNLQNSQEVVLPVESQDGHDVVQRIEVQADLDRTMFAEVTFAVSINGGDYAPIGTDNNPPYRVFYDVTMYRGQTDMPSLSFKAIVSDLNGNINSAKVTGITPKIEEPAAPTGMPYAAIHYLRTDSDYGDHTTGDFTQFWGLHLWGEAIDASTGTDWDKPAPFLIETDYGRAVSIKLADASKDMNFIVHKENTKDGGDEDRKFNPATDGPEIWIKQDDGNFYTSQAAAQGYVTINYHRPDGAYDGWGLHLWGDALDASEVTDWSAPKMPTGAHEFGKYWQVKINPDKLDQPVNFIVHKGDDKDPDADLMLDASSMGSAWVKSGDITVYPTRAAAENYALIHYHRLEGDYGDSGAEFTEFWGMHVWTGAVDGTSWQNPLKPTGTDAYGVYFKVPLEEGADALNYIIHKGDDKDPGADQKLDVTKFGYNVWQHQIAPDGEYDENNPYIFPIFGEAGAGGDLSLAKAIWLTADTIVWNVKHADSNQYALHHDPDGAISLADGTMGESISLTYDANGLSDTLKAKYPHLSGYPVFKLGADDLAKVPAVLKDQLAISLQVGGTVMDATGIQIAGVLDDLYAKPQSSRSALDTELGVVYANDVPSLQVWAPTARNVTLHVFDDTKPETTSTTKAMTLDSATGIWSVTGSADWSGKYYLYEVEVYVHSTGMVEKNMVTDPYSVGLAMNSSRSLIVDLNSDSLKPANWDTVTKPALAALEDIALYELHVRDFSIKDMTVAEANRGTFKAFTEVDSNGMKHLKGLAEAGLTHVHLLPVFDIATIDEDKANRSEPTITNAGADSEEQQAKAEEKRATDGFNWGYDPYHYTTPEGSYSTNPDGTARIIEFREMVKTLNENGLRVVMDVVYNHTNASGQNDKSVLDKVVPGYYHRLLEDGSVATSTCCQNTATENAMMEKLMVDSVKTWAEAYKVDGFRFDLMGHHTKANMEKVQSELQKIDPSIYVYGEGWDFGEIGNNARFTQATQINMAGTGIGTFNDRLRDAVRGGGPFDGGQSRIFNQGFINGLAYDVNITATKQFTPGQIQNEALLSADQIRVGLAGNLADYEFMGKDGEMVKGSAVDYNGAPAGYTKDPQEHINYVSAHDNETLFDISQYKHPITTTMTDRVRAHNVGLSLTALSQGVPFFHAGADMLRSKSMDRNSYDSGDWFNKLDFTYADNNWGVGLPPATDNQGDWVTMRPFLSNSALKPASADIMNTTMYAKEMLQIRKSSPLFRLRTEADVMSRVMFHNTGPSQKHGLIVMSLSDMVTDTADLDSNYEMIGVLFNANDEAQTFAMDALKGASMVLHPIQANGSDPVVKGATFDSASGMFTIPARTTAVFVDSAAPTIEKHSIRDIKGANGDPIMGIPVATEGTVTANFGSRIFIQDDTQSLSGIVVYRTAYTGTVMVGDRVIVAGTVEENFGVTQFAQDSMLQVISSSNTLPTYKVLPTGQVGHEDWESMLVKVENVTVTNDNVGHGEWEVNDGSGALLLDDLANGVTVPPTWTKLDAIQAPLYFSYYNFKMVPRNNDDILTGPSINKTAPSSVSAGGLYTYTITVDNQAGFDLTDLVISDVVPISSTFAYASDGGTHSNGVVTWPVATLANKATATVQFAVTATNMAGTIIRNNDYGFTASNYGRPIKGQAVGTAVGQITISMLQGTGAETPLNGQTVSGITGTVTADFMASNKLRGFFMQNPKDTSVANASTGIFVYTGALSPTVSLSSLDMVVVAGEVQEWNGQTQLRATSVSTTGTGSAITPTQISFPVSTTTSLERYEGMLVTTVETMTVSYNYYQGQYGQVTLSSDGRLFKSTNVYTPSSNEATTLAELNTRRWVVLDDASNYSNPDPVPYIGQDNTLRVGDTIATLTGVLDSGRIGTGTGYRIQPTITPTIVRANNRSATPPVVSGTFKVASFNTLNYFTTLGERGADDEAEFNLQRTKTITALLQMNADVIGLMELENNGYLTDSAIYNLVDGLNMAQSTDVYSYVHPDTPRLGTDAIAVGFIYKTNTTELVGSAVTTNTGAFADYNRQPLAQTFKEKATEQSVTIVVNHLKSKGSSTGRPEDDDQGDGQGYSNDIRTKGAQQLASWLATDPTSSGDTDVLVIGDLNAYAMEDPVRALETAGYTNLVKQYAGENAYSYIFNAESGYLDHALSNSTLSSQVTGAAEWHINADEPRALEYGGASNLYQPDAYRSSDHDAVLVGLSLK
ncbi:pullulanase-type alpha-1,6-glucosidase [Anaerolineales bacterium HSG6]|nr:pullulanase-type alpha-1,6-glucosidase [Anaerolineales bacterium HSG6]